jgi:hypothetical protein
MAVGLPGALFRSGINGYRSRYATELMGLCHCPASQQPTALTGEVHLRQLAQLDCWLALPGHRCQAAVSALVSTPHTDCH